MHIFIKENRTGNKIIEALSSIPGYKTTTLTKTETFDKELGIIPGKVKIRMLSLLPTARVFGYPILITIDNIVLTCKYHSIDMRVNYVYNDGTIFEVKILTDNSGNKTALTKIVEVVIKQFLKNLDRKPELNYALEV